jgi:lipoprotein signal peptidase
MSLRPGVVLAAAILLADQASKWFMLEVLEMPEVRHIPLLALGPFGFDLTMVWNRGVTFGLLQGDQPWHAWALAGLAAIIVGFLLRWMARADSLRVGLSLGAIIGGAVGNMIDRFRFGAVADFFDAHAFGWHWYVFNVADAAIVVGVAVLAFDALFPPKAGGNQTA